MRQVRDIRQYKTALRERYRGERERMDSNIKQQMDEKIRGRIGALRQYQNCEVLLTYVSTPIEVDTRGLIEQAWKDAKRVAVPRCIPGTRDMDFYFIQSMQDLEKGSFGVLEPKPDKCEKLTDLSQGLCVVPAFCFDYQGYRLGYGKGYYDRFLSRFNGIKVGICYASGVRYHLYHGRYDCAVDLLVTEKYLRRARAHTRNKGLKGVRPAERKDNKDG